MTVEVVDEQTVRRAPVGLFARPALLLDNELLGAVRMDDREIGVESEGSFPASSSMVMGSFPVWVLVAKNIDRWSSACVRTMLAVSSTSIGSGSSRVDAVPRTSWTSPRYHWRRSSVWMAWLISTPPPAVAQRPRLSLRW